MAKYRLVRIIEGQWLVEDFTEDQLVAAMEVRGMTYDKIETGRQLREELQGQPRFNGVAGPMWGGEEEGQPVIRYEDWKAYDRLSI